MTNRITVQAVRDRNHLIVWCQYCEKDHFHGVCSGCPSCPAQKTRGRKHCTCPTGSGDGHRAAHCSNPESPYRARGYFIREVTQ